MILKPFQVAALTQLQSRKIHLVCASPTGSGKGVILEKICDNAKERVLLLTPLIALARQQSSRFEERGVLVHQTLGEMHSSPPDTESRVWMMSPERLLSARTQDQIRHWKPTLIAIDECHCIWEWGKGFRPAYELIPKWVKDSSFCRTFWMSATLPKTSLIKLKKALEPESVQVIGSFELPELLTYEIQKIRYQDRNSALIHFLKSRRDESGIVFGLSRKITESLHRLLHEFGVQTIVYHAGLSKEERRHIEARLRTEKRLVALATNAFGLGMDFANLDFVCAYQPSFNLLSLIQAMGRVGRRRRGRALIFYHEEDFRILSQTFVRSEDDRKDIQLLYEFLNSEHKRRGEILQSYFT